MKKSTLSSFKTRSVTGIIYAVILLAAIFAGKYYFSAVLAVLVILSIHEYLKMTIVNPIYNNYRITLLVAGIIFFAWQLLIISNFEDYLLVLSIIYLIFILSFALFLKNSQSFLLQLFYGYIWILFPASIFIIFLIQQPENYYLMLIPVVLTWISDTFAYLGGILFGKHKLIPKLSPLKTVEGFITGIVFTVLAAFVFYQLTNHTSLLNSLLAGFIISIASVFGDLFESLIKRQHKVKDSGKLLPGHGGILDRIDSFLIVFPTFVIICKLLY